MSQSDRYEALVLGSGEGGKFLAWHLARSGQRTAVVERRWIGGSCPNINCLPSKNEIWSAKVADLVHHAAQFGTMTGSVAIDMAKVRQRKRDMVDGLIAMHLENYKASGAELIMGERAFRRAEDARGAPERRRDARADGRAGVPQRRNACRRSRTFPASRPPGR